MSDKQTEGWIKVIRGKKRRASADCAPARGYTALVERIETTITLCKELCSEAYKRGDQVAVWEMGETIKHMERMKASMEKSRAV